ncbi:amidohydrolase family protein [Sphingomonas sp.]|jgi:imidazolonepropionase-like amidohydrolase|uniref:amidohydrolase family protein n=1 Tax=Sphingomonas sp. TaxID=28214 RepID=UPI002ED8F052
MPVRRLFRRLAGAVALAAALVAAPAFADTLVLHGFTLIDGTGRAPVRNAGMVITDGRIRWVGPAAGMRTPKGAKVVRLAGKYVMPGLIDTHVHLGISKDLLTVSAANQTREHVIAQLRQFASYGVTTIQTMGTEQDIVLQMRDEQRRTGRPMEARIYAAGLGVVVEGGYGGLAGVTRKVGTAGEATAAVNQEAARKVDLIKFWLDDELGTMPKLPPEISGASIAAAHAHRLNIVAHIFYLADARRVVDQGIDGLGHGVRDQPVDPGLIAAMKAHGSWQMASTLARERALFAYGSAAPWLNDPFFVQAVPADTLRQLADPARQSRVAAGPNFAKLEGFLRMAQRNLKTLADAGVPYAMGTDAGGPLRFPGHAEHDELVLMVEAGLTPMQAIVAATSSGAKFMKAVDIGSLQAGKWADLIVLDADPLKDIRNSRTIRAVYVAGRPVASIKR